MLQRVTIHLWCVKEVIELEVYSHDLLHTSQVCVYVRLTEVMNWLLYLLCLLSRPSLEYFNKGFNFRPVFEICVSAALSLPTTGTKIVLFCDAVQWLTIHRNFC